jgi:hypothetical protein
MIECFVSNDQGQTFRHTAKEIHNLTKKSIVPFIVYVNGCLRFKFHPIYKNDSAPRRLTVYDFLNNTRNVYSYEIYKTTSIYKELEV